MTAQYTKKVLVRDIANYFSLEQITGDKTSLERWVVVADMNRPGFELSGYFKLTEPRRIVIIGNKEIEYIKKCVKQDYITYSNKCKIIEILEKEEENIEWLSLFMKKES